MKHITTGSDALDELLGGGIPTQMITEVYGKNSSGKTQLAQQLAVNVQLPEEEGGLGKQAIYIDTEYSYIAERIDQLAKGSGLDPEEVAENIFIRKASSTDHQMKLAEKAQREVQNDDRDIGIIIVDSIISHFRTEFTGRNELPERQQKLNNHMHTLERIARNTNCAVFITNQVMEDPGKMWGDPVQPVGGNVLAHNSTTRMYLKSTGQKPSSKKWRGRLTDSPYLPQAEVEFMIKAEGVRDMEE